MTQALHPLKTRDRILVAAIDLFQAQGYHQTGLNQIIEAANAPKGSLYHHFPKGKEQLACDAIKMASNEVLMALVANVAGAPSAVSVVERLLDYFAAQMLGSDFRKGCPVATIALEQAGSSEPIRQACEAAYFAWTQAMASVLTTFQVQDSAQLAQTILATVEGSLILARTRRSTEPLRNARSLIVALLNSQGDPTP